MSDNKNNTKSKIRDFNSASDYIKYSDRENEKEAVEALYNYYNTQKYIQIMQTN